MKYLLLTLALASAAPAPAVAAETEHRGCAESLGHATFCFLGALAVYGAISALSEIGDPRPSEPSRDDEPRDLIPGGASTHTVAPPYLGRMDDTLDQGCAWGSLEYGTCH